MSAKRSLIPALLLGCLAGVSPARGQEDAWSHPAIGAGPMVGYATETEVALWVQTRHVADVVVEVRQVEAAAGQPPVTWETPPQRARLEDSLCLTFAIGDLPFGGRFRYGFRIDGGELVTHPSWTFRTQPHWRWRTGPPEFTVAFGSCAYVNEAAYDRPGRPYGGDPVIFERIAEQKPDLMLWLGDNCYFREPDWTSASGMRRRRGRSRLVPQLRPLLASTSNYAIWDDHDYGPDNSDWTFANRAASLESFQLFWANPSYGLPEHPGVFFRFSWGDAEFFMLDDRYHRSPNLVPTNEDKGMLGEKQLRWLVDSLSSSRARFRIVANGNQMLNPRIPYEAWGHFPAEQDRFLAAIIRRKIPGLVFLSGDRHHAELLKIDREGGYPLHEFTSSPLLSGVGGLHRRERDNPAHVPGTVITDARNFGLLRFSGKGDDRTLTLEARDATGKKRWQRAIKATSLRWPR